MLCISLDMSVIMHHILQYPSRQPCAWCKTQPGKAFKGVRETVFIESVEVMYYCGHSIHQLTQVDRDYVSMQSGASDENHTKKSCRRPCYQQTVTIEMYHSYSQIFAASVIIHQSGTETNLYLQRLINLYLQRLTKYRSYRFNLHAKMDAFNLFLEQTNIHMISMSERILTCVITLYCIQSANT